jgi:hypothetical protein
VESQKDSIIQPRGLRGTKLPWEMESFILPTLTRVESIPYITFIKFDFVPLHQFVELILKCDFPVVSYLTGDLIVAVFCGEYGVDQYF